MLLKLLIGIALLYVLVAGALFLMQTSIFFPTRLVPLAGPLPADAERIELKATDGVRLEGVHIPASGGNRDSTLIFGFAGNASNAAATAEFLHELYPEYPVVAFHYRGYAPSGGAPSAATLLDDAPVLYDFARERLRPRRVVIVGISIGSGIAAGLAARRPVDGLILVTPFDSLKAVARDQFPWLPISLLLRHELPSAETLNRSEVPVAIVAAERDEVIPPPRTEALRRSVRNLVFDVTIAGARHNDIAFHPDFGPNMRAALNHVRADPAS